MTVSFPYCCGGGVASALVVGIAATQGREHDDRIQELKKEAKKTLEHKGKL
jgi:hypothetical protein